jgi:hypothetical protein
VINHAQVAHVCVINTHTSAGFDRGLDDCACLVHNVTAPVENITARVIRTVLANNERFGRLITDSRAFCRRGDDRSCYVVVVPCFLSVELGWANASGAISKQPSVIIIFLMFRLLLLMHIC